jgi:receptor protein-tyrosine kinase
LNRVIPAFDWVIIDSPPCLPVADASILADIADGVLFVVRAGATSSNLVRKAQQVHKSKLVGVVLNAIERKALYRSRQYSY